MPELPEVQTVIDDLNKKIKGDIVADFWSDWPKAIKGKSLKEFQKEIKNRKILNARRIGKNIFVDLSGKKTLYIHLKMTGHLLVKAQNTNNKAQTKHKAQNTKSQKYDYFSDRVNQYIHHIWYLADAKQRMKSESTKSTKNTKDKFVDTHNFVGSNRTLEFSDMRKFAKIVLDDTEKINNLSEIRKLGVDAMSPQFTLKKFKEILKKKENKPVGIILMDQESIAGIGNIYRSEILFESNVFPQRKIKTLKDIEIKKIYQNIKKVLKKAIKLRGTSDSDYRDTEGKPGGFQKIMKVYQQAGKKCPKCDTIIKRMTLGQRSVFYCSKCQK